MEKKPKIVCVAEGLMIFSKYPETDFEVCAEHDVIYAGPGSKGLISEGDRDTLKGLGWHWNNEIESWGIYV